MNWTALLATIVLAGVAWLVTFATGMLAEEAKDDWAKDPGFGVIVSILLVAITVILATQI